MIGDKVYDCDQASVGYATGLATRKATVIRQVYHMCVTQEQDRHRLERATCGKRCPRYGDKDRVVRFD